MSIVFITGPAESGKSLIANALRNNQINKGGGALLIDETTEAEVGPLVEKLINGAPLPRVVPEDLSNIPWKKSPMLILVGPKGKEWLAKFEERVPGLTKFLGQAYTVQTGRAK